jgi:arsenite-transporting ATPase
MRLVLYTGKGGVGKTTTAAATAVCAAERGVSTLVVSADAAHSLGDVLGVRLAAAPVRVAENLDAVELDARAEMSLHYGAIREYLVEFFRYQGIDEVLADELALLPGAEEITALLAVEEIAQSGQYELVIVDCAPTGSALRLLSLPDMLSGVLRLLPNLLRVVSSVVSPVVRTVIDMPLPRSRVFRDLQRLVDQRAVQLRKRLSAPTTTVRLVATPERMVIDEARRAYMELSLFDVGCDAVIMNRLLPDAAGREEFFRASWETQQERRREVEERFAPVAVIDAALQRDEVTGLDALAEHGRQIFRDHAPEAVISTAPRIRFSRHAEGQRVHVPLPGASASDLEVSMVDEELVVRAGARRRAIPLPPRVSRLELGGAKLNGDTLVVSFAPRADGARPSAV